jgi:hypothetical protein
LTNLGSESKTCVGSRVHLVGVSISFEKNFYRLPFTPPLSGSPYRSFSVEDEVAMERVDALAADAAGVLAEAFEEFLFPDAADAAAPPA